MLIVDASALYSLLAADELAASVRAAMAADDEQAAPYLIDAEVVNVAQTHERRGLLSADAASLIVDDLVSWPGRRWPHAPLLPRVWELRHQVRSYDALYVALAEALDAALLTCDVRLGRAHDVRCDVVVVR